MKKLAVILGLALVLTFGSAQVRGVTDDEIIIGNWGQQSGPAAAWGTVTKAIEAYFSYINDQGGIHGRTLKLVTRDDGYDPARTVSAVREMRDQRYAFASV